MKKLIWGCALGFLIAMSVHAAYPDRVVTMVVPFPAGGSTDMLARVLSEKMGQSTGQTFVVENKPGATGAIGAAQVKRAAPDGYTFLVASIGVYATNPFLQKNLAYDPATDFDLLTVAVRAPNVLVVKTDLPVNNLSEFLAYLKKNPGKVTFASSGAGSSDHLTAELFWQQTGTTGVHIPYKGGAPAQTDLMGGHVDASFQNINAVVSHIKAGKMKALAITGERRSDVLPDVPTLEEAGVKEVNVFSWQGVAAPKGLPKDVKAKLHSELVKALNAPDVKERLTNQGFEIVGNTPEQFEQFLNGELRRWKTVIEKGNITLN